MSEPMWRPRRGPIERTPGGARGSRRLVPVVVAACLGTALVLAFHSAGRAQDEPPPEAGAEAGDDLAQDDEGLPADDTLAEDGLAGEVQADAAEAGPNAGQPLVTSAVTPFGFLLSDSELVYGPSLWGFDTVEFVDERRGYLSTVVEPVGTEMLRGPEIVQRVAEDYGVGPRVLLALLELNAGWVSLAAPAQRSAPLGGDEASLYGNLSAAAEDLLAAYYGRKLTGAADFALADGSVATLPDVNGGTLAVMAWLGARTAPETWAGLEYPSRFWATWTRLFGDPYVYDIAARRPARTNGPTLRAPIPAAEMWYYVQGPHGAGGPATPWSAVDFAPPPPDEVGCTPSAAWVASAAAGTVVRSRVGSVVVELDDDGFAGTGWAHVYRHVSGADLPAIGRRVRAGERLGHPSCEGGATAPARVSFARMYDGEWIAVADPASPLILGSWLMAPGPREGAGPLVGTGFTARQPGPQKQPAVNGVFVSP